MIRYEIPKNSSYGPPLYYRAAQAWSHFFYGKRGEFFLFSLLLKLGLLNRVCKFQHFEEGIFIPLDITDTLSVKDFSLYHGLREINFANFIYRNLGKFTLIDCGAAFGQISMRLASICPTLDSIIAIDPNSSHCEILNKNLSLTKIKFNVIHAAVSDFSGNASLIFPNGEHDTHSAYIKKAENGPIKVVKIDELMIEDSTSIAMKLDVEGQEKAAIIGAKKTIAKAKSICYFVEIHPAVLERNNENAEDLLQTISDIRPTKWYLADNPSFEIDANKPFFSQVKEKRQYDVIGVSV